MNKRSRWREPLFDLKKIARNEDYFRVWVFRSFLLLIVLFTVFVSWSNGWRLSWEFAYCPISDFVTPCIVSFKSNLFSATETITLQQGESWGYNPNFFGEHFVSFVFGLLALAFVVNHLLFKRRENK